MTSNALVEDLAATVSFSTPDWLRRLKAATHQRVDSNWYEESQICTAVLLSISNTLEPDLVIGEFLYSDNAAFWTNLILFERIIESVDFGVAQIVRLECSLPPETYRNGAIGGYLQAIKRWVARHPSRGGKLLDFMLTREGITARRLFVMALEGLAEAAQRGEYDRKQFYAYVASGLASDEDLRAGVVVAYPALVNYGVATEDDYKLRLTEWVSRENSETIVAAAVQSIFLTLSHGRESTEYIALLRTVALDDRQQVQIRLIEAMRPIVGVETDPARQLLYDVVPSFALIDTQHQATIETLSWLLFGLAGNHPHLVMKVLRRWAERADDPKPLWHSTRFLNVIDLVPNDVFVAEVIQWIIASPRLEEVGLRLILQERQLLSIPTSVIATLTPSEIELSALIFAWHETQRESVQLLASIVSGALTRDDCTHLAPTFETLLDHVVASYPGTASRIVATIQESKTTASRKLVRTLRRAMTSREQALKTVHGMPDFVPSIDRQRIYQRLDHEFRREVNKTDIDDPGRFPFLSIMKGREVQLLGGRAILSTDAQTFGAVQPLGQISVEMEWPLLEVLDPHSEYLRGVFLRAQIEKRRSEIGGMSATHPA